MLHFLQLLLSQPILQPVKELQFRFQMSQLEMLFRGIGVLVPMGDIGAMANAMEKLGKDPDERSSIGRRARSVVRQKFSKENTSMQLAALYKKILNQ